MSGPADRVSLPHESDTEVRLRLAQRGTCIHSYFAPGRGQPCAGCLVRESQRALGMLLDALEHGVSSPSHGLEIEDRDDAIKKARFVYEMVEGARG